MGDGAHPVNIIGNDLALPFWIQEIPVRLDLFGIHKFGVKGVFAAVHIALKNENISSLGIGVVVFAVPPFRFIGDFGED